MVRNFGSISKRCYKLRIKRAIARRSLVREAFASQQLSNEQSIVLDLPNQNTTQHEEDDEVRSLSGCSSDDESDEEHSSESLRDSLRHWTSEFNVTQTATTALQKILRENGLSDLPSDARTLLQTAKHRDIVSVPPGQYCHIGLRKALAYYKRNYASNADVLTVDFNIDGLPISNSSQSHFWMILAGVTANSCSRQIYVVGAYHGYNKPKSFPEFLAPFIEEATELGNFEVEGNPVTIKIRCIICDAPARNSCLGTKSYSAYFGCGRCDQEGFYSTTHGMTYPEIHSSKRTNESFRNKAQPEHHNYDSPFLKLDIDMISQFPLDCLHTVYLGVTKKIVNIMIHGGDRKNKRGKLKSHDVQRISDRLMQVAQYQPSEFQRKCRPLNHASHFKGAEYRSLILYILPIVTKNILPIDEYHTILVLHVSLTILSDPVLCVSHASVAQSLLEEFVRLFGEVYGADHLVYNVHSLLHIVDDVKMYGPIDSYSAFPFESFMYKVKRMVHKKNQSLAQICNRVEESYLLNAPKKVTKSNVEFKKKCQIINGHIFKEVVFEDFKINNNNRDQWFLNQDSEICKFVYCKSNRIEICARKIVKKKEFYNLPISSEHFNIFVSDGTLSDEFLIPLSNVKCKNLSMPLDNEWIFAPLRHSM